MSLNFDQKLWMCTHSSLQLITEVITRVLILIHDMEDTMRPDVSSSTAA